MAPRKRTTRQHKVDPRMAKLEAFLQDFDCEVETRVRLMKEKLKQLLKDVDNSYDMALLKMPKAIRQSSWLEHYKSEKPKSPLVDNTKREEEAATVDSVMVEDHAVLLKSVKKTKKNGGARSSSDDENVPRTTRKGRTTKKPPSTSKRAKALSVTTQNTSIRRSNRRPLVTPARNMMDSSLMMGATPLFTPRFDPRLPKTPAVRVPRHKERVYSISGQRFSHRRGKRGHCHQHPQRQRREPPAVGQPDQHGGPVTAGPDCSEEHPAAAESPLDPVWTIRVTQPSAVVLYIFRSVCPYF
ncbi:hypothetical protein fugu_018430 [Takifugu bimaculatus]|uniref:Uncharacterized protein n=1 Tax=Takifugu bimaculatus TaxID=433685 RepID=A0A4Z2BMW4_9TELE|nr:hypothetical protein fugu_018430 [Takifugu bimaculatus]